MGKRGAKEKLTKAFFVLLETERYTKISVADLITEAGCSRTTFYRYYTDVIDMYNKICEEMVQALLENLADCLATENRNFGKMLDEFCSKLASQNTYIALLCGKNGGRTFFEIGLSKANAMVNAHNPSFSDGDKFLLRFVVFSLISSYVKSLMDETGFDKKYFEISKSLLSNIGKEGAVIG